jgi:photosystem II stability/assembly factor-like uncharacterized protein
VTGQGADDTILVPQNRIAADAQVQAVTTSPAAPDALFAMAQGLGITVSTDAGTTWTTLGPALDTRELLALAISADDPNLILVGTDRGVYEYRRTSQ